MNKPAKIVIALLCIALIVLAVVAINYNNDLNNQWYAQLADMRADLEALTASEEAAPLFVYRLSQPGQKYTVPPI